MFYPLALGLTILYLIACFSASANVFKVIIVNKQGIKFIWILRSKVSSILLFDEGISCHHNIIINKLFLRTNKGPKVPFSFYYHFLWIYGFYLCTIYLLSIYLSLSIFLIYFLSSYLYLHICIHISTAAP